MKHPARVAITVAVVLLLPASVGAAFAGVEVIAAISAIASTAIFVGGPTIGSIALSVALTVGTTLISAAMAPDAPSFDDNTRVNGPESRYTTRQSSPPKRDIYGTAHVGGAIFFEEIKPPYLYRGYAIAAHEIDGIEAIYVGTERLSFLALPANVILTPQAVDDQPAFDQNLQVSIRLGTTDQTIDPLLSADFRHLDESFRQQGVATVVVRCDFGADEDEHRELWGSGDPKFFFLVRGRKVYDPRKIGQIVDDETTWEFENNATLCQTDYIRQPHGGRIDHTRIDWERIAESADYDDDLCGCKDGTLIRRYTVDGLSARDQSPADVISSMLTANGGTLVQDGGMIWIDSSQPRDPCVTIYDDLMVGGIAYRNDKPKRDLVNTTQSRFVADEREFTTADGPVLEDADLIAEDGEPLTGTLTLPWTRDYRRVERLQTRSQDIHRPTIGHLL